MAAQGEKKNIVIIGGGIIGCTTAYYLTRHPAYDPSLHSITLLEASKIAGGASGKAGGLLGLWAYPSCIVPLSYREHAKLAKEHGGEQRWGYRPVHCGQISARGRSLKALAAAVDGKGGDSKVSLQKRTKEAISSLRKAGIPEDLDWIAPESLEEYDEMGDPENTAQVHPYQFTTSMAALAEEKGAKIILGAVSDIEKSGDQVKSVTYSDKASGESHTIPATDVIISAGPWTRNVYPKAPISSIRAHSVVIRAHSPISPYALFTEISLPAGFSKKSRGPSYVAPEIYARPNDEAYCCGEGDRLVPLPKTSDAVEVDESRCQDILDQVASISDELKDGDVIAKQACYLPNVTAGNGPLIGQTGTKGLLMAAGHTCWGIQNGPGTGKLMSEFVFDGKAKSANVSSLDPRKVL
ncbi:fad NAD binding oxidoreductase [Xylona heveae TC161]|uniref:Fad NAD binding oxidoreductase n=1 Tax=Xylona heveae (strain CBS 132557 / TC161) TaxID=1328760 RepID=A0A165FUG1_XYLHT|nr:fad NAD binding oxidoreductase [Xylona heveae TC161]KZF21396.1 fad NAD binding oxidoreductase [Xylona heveae TC161]